MDEENMLVMDFQDEEGQSPWPSSMSSTGETSNKVAGKMKVIRTYQKASRSVTTKRKAHEHNELLIDLIINHATFLKTDKNQFARAKAWSEIYEQFIKETQSDVTLNSLKKRLSHIQGRTTVRMKRFLQAVQSRTLTPSMVPGHLDLKIIRHFPKCLLSYNLCDFFKPYIEAQKITETEDKDSNDGSLSMESACENSQSPDLDSEQLKADEGSNRGYQIIDTETGGVYEMNDEYLDEVEINNLLIGYGKGANLDFILSKVLSRQAYSDVFSNTEMLGRCKSGMKMACFWKLIETELNDYGYNTKPAVLKNKWDTITEMVKAKLGTIKSYSSCRMALKGDFQLFWFILLTFPLLFCTSLIEKQDEKESPQDEYEFPEMTVHEYMELFSIPPPVRPITASSSSNESGRLAKPIKLPDKSEIIEMNKKLQTASVSPTISRPNVQKNNRGSTIPWKPDGRYFRLAPWMQKPKISHEIVMQETPPPKNKFAEGDEKLAYNKFLELIKNASSYYKESDPVVDNTTPIVPKRKTRSSQRGRPLKVKPRETAAENSADSQESVTAVQAIIALSDVQNDPSSNEFTDAPNTHEPFSEFVSLNTLMPYTATDEFVSLNSFLPNMSSNTRSPSMANVSEIPQDILPETVNILPDDSQITNKAANAPPALIPISQMKKMNKNNESTPDDTNTDQRVITLDLSNSENNDLSQFKDIVDILQSNNLSIQSITTLDPTSQNIPDLDNLQTSNIGNGSQLIYLPNPEYIVPDLSLNDTSTTSASVGESLLLTVDEAVEGTPDTSAGSENLCALDNSEIKSAVSTENVSNSDEVTTKIKSVVCTENVSNSDEVTTEISPSVSENKPETVSETDKSNNVRTSGNIEIHNAPLCEETLPSTVSPENISEAIATTSNQSPEKNSKNSNIDLRSYYSTLSFMDAPSTENSEVNYSNTTQSEESVDATKLRDKIENSNTTVHQELQESNKASPLSQTRKKKQIIKHVIVDKYGRVKFMPKTIKLLKLDSGVDSVNKGNIITSPVKADGTPLKLKVVPKLCKINTTVVAGQRFLTSGKVIQQASPVKIGNVSIVSSPLKVYQKCPINTDNPDKSPVKTIVTSNATITSIPNNDDTTRKANVESSISNSADNPDKSPVKTITTSNATITSIPNNDDTTRKANVESSISNSADNPDKSPVKTIITSNATITSIPNNDDTTQRANVESSISNSANSTNIKLTTSPPSLAPISTMNTVDNTAGTPSPVKIQSEQSPAKIIKVYHTPSKDLNKSSEYLKHSPRILKSSQSLKVSKIEYEKIRDIANVNNNIRKLVSVRKFQQHVAHRIKSIANKIIKGKRDEKIFTNIDNVEEGEIINISDEDDSKTDNEDEINRSRDDENKSFAEEKKSSDKETDGSVNDIGMVEEVDEDRLFEELKNSDSIKDNNEDGIYLIEKSGELSNSDNITDEGKRDNVQDCTDEEEWLEDIVEIDSSSSDNDEPISKLSTNKSSLLSSAEEIDDLMKLLKKKIADIAKSKKNKKIHKESSELVNLLEKKITDIGGSKSKKKKKKKNKESDNIHVKELSSSDSVFKHKRKRKIKHYKSKNTSVSESVEREKDDPKTKNANEQLTYEDVISTLDHVDKDENLVIGVSKNKKRKLTEVELLKQSDKLYSENEKDNEKLVNLTNDKTKEGSDIETGKIKRNLRRKDKEKTLALNTKLSEFTMEKTEEEIKEDEVVKMVSLKSKTKKKKVKHKDVDESSELENSNLNTLEQNSDIVIEDNSSGKMDVDSKSTDIVQKQEKAVEVDMKEADKNSKPEAEDNVLKMDNNGVENINKKRKVKRKGNETLSQFNENKPVEENSKVNIEKNKISLNENNFINVKERNKFIEKDKSSKMVKNDPSNLEDDNAEIEVSKNVSEKSNVQSGKRNKTMKTKSSKKIKLSEINPSNIKDPCNIEEISEPDVELNILVTDENIKKVKKQKQTEKETLPEIEIKDPYSMEEFSDPKLDKAVTEGKNVNKVKKRKPKQNEKDKLSEIDNAEVFSIANSNKVVAEEKNVKKRKSKQIDIDKPPNFDKKDPQSVEQFSDADSDLIKIVTDEKFVNKVKRRKSKETEKGISREIDITDPYSIEQFSELDEELNKGTDEKIVKIKRRKSKQTDKDNSIGIAINEPHSIEEFSKVNADKIVSESDIVKLVNKNKKRKIKEIEKLSLDIDTKDPYNIDELLLEDNAGTNKVITCMNISEYKRKKLKQTKNNKSSDVIGNIDTVAEDTLGMGENIVENTEIPSVSSEIEKGSIKVQTNDNPKVGTNEKTKLKNNRKKRVTFSFDDELGVKKMSEDITQELCKKKLDEMLKFCQVGDSSDSNSSNDVLPIIAISKRIKKLSKTKEDAKNVSGKSTMGSSDEDDVPLSKVKRTKNESRSKKRKTL